MPQRSVDPRLPLLLLAVLIVGFIWWLGDQTPEQAAPVTTLLHTAVETGQMTSIQLGPDGVSVGLLNCGLASGSGFVSGEFADQLIFSLSGSTCIAPRDGSAAPSIVENAQRAFPIAESASTGWFCDDSVGQPRVAAYEVGGSLGSWIEAPACPYLADSGRLLVSNSQADLNGETVADFAPYWWRPWDPLTETPESIIGSCEFVGIIGTRALCRDGEVVQVFDLVTGELLAEPNYLVPPGALAVGTASPSGRYLFLQSLDPNSRLSGVQGGAVFDLESALRARPVTGVSGLVQTTWTSDEQLVLLVFPNSPDCEGCGSAIHLWDLATGQSELLLPLPTESVAFSLQLIAS